MIDRIDTDSVKEKSQSPQGIKYRIKRPLNDFEVEVRDKINELVDKFNEVFPL